MTANLKKVLLLIKSNFSEMNRDFRIYENYDAIDLNFAESEKDAFEALPDYHPDSVIIFQTGKEVRIDRIIRTLKKADVQLKVVLILNKESGKEDELYEGTAGLYMNNLHVMGGDRNFSNSSFDNHHC